MNLGPWSARLRPRPTTIELRVFQPGRELLRASLPHPPRHPRALVTVLEGLALWQGGVLRVAACVDSTSEHFGLSSLGLQGPSLDDPGSPLLHAYEVSPAKRQFRVWISRNEPMWDLDLTGGER